MQINLRKARKLDSAINTIATLDPDYTSISILASTNDEEATNRLMSAKKALEEQNLNVLKLKEVQFSVRRKIELANEALGIHQKMNERELVKAKLAYYDSLLNLDTCEQQEALDMLAAKRASLAKGETVYGGNKVGVNISTLNKQEKNVLETQQLELQRELENVEEELLQKNVGGKITLTSDEVEVLKLNGLV